MFDFDLINWLDGLLAEMRWGTHTFIVLYRVGWTGYEIECLLRRYGIYVYGRLYNKLSPDTEHYGFRVAKHQANWAEYLLFRAGCPITSPTFNPANERYRAQYNKHASVPPGGWGRQARGIGRIMDFLAPFAGVPVNKHNHDLAIEQRKRVNPSERGVANGRYQRGHTKNKSS